MLDRIREKIKIEPTENDSAVSEFYQLLMLIIVLCMNSLVVSAMDPATSGLMRAITILFGWFGIILVFFQIDNIIQKIFGVELDEFLAVLFSFLREQYVSITAKQTDKNEFSEDIVEDRYHLFRTEDDSVDDEVLLRALDGGEIDRE
jgi:hypothetical protein